MLFRQGDPGLYFYIVIEGHVELMYQDMHGQERVLQSRHAGDSLGENVLLGKAAKYTTNAVVGDDEASFLRITPTHYNMYISKVGEARRSNWETMLGDNILDVFKRVDLFSRLHPWMMELLGNLFTYKTVRGGDVIIEEGVQDSRSMYIISKGLVDIFVTDIHKNTQTKVATFQPGQYFGELALILDMPRTATAIAQGPGLLLELRAAAFYNFLSIVPDVQAAFAKLAKVRMAEKVRLANIHFFSLVPPDQFEDLASSAEIVSVNEGTIILDVGSPSRTFNFIMHGDVSIQTPAGIELVVLRQGSHFGELGLIADTVRTTKAVARTRTVMLSYARDKFATFFNADPAAFAELSIRLARHNAPVREFLRHPRARAFLLQFCEKERSTENVEFYSDVELYKHLPQEALLMAAQRIYEEYVEPGRAPREINLKSGNISAIQKQIEEGKVDEGTFKAAQDEIIFLMRDTLQRFKRHPLFEEMLLEFEPYVIPEEGKAPPESPRGKTLSTSSTSGTTPTAASGGGGGGMGPNSPGGSMSGFSKQGLLSPTAAGGGGGGGSSGQYQPFGSLSTSTSSSPSYAQSPVGLGGARAVFSPLSTTSEAGSSIGNGNTSPLHGGGGSGSIMNDGANTPLTALQISAERAVSRNNIVIVGSSALLSPSTNSVTKAAFGSSSFAPIPSPSNAAATAALFASNGTGTATAGGAGTGVSVSGSFPAKHIQTNATAIVSSMPRTKSVDMRALGGHSSSPSTPTPTAISLSSSTPPPPPPPPLPLLPPSLPPLPTRLSSASPSSPSSLSSSSSSTTSSPIPKPLPPPPMPPPLKASASTSAAVPAGAVPASGVSTSSVTLLLPPPT